MGVLIGGNGRPSALVIVGHKKLGKIYQMGLFKIYSWDLAISPWSALRGRQSGSGEVGPRARIGGA